MSRSIQKKVLKVRPVEIVFLLGLHNARTVDLTFLYFERLYKQRILKCILNPLGGSVRIILLIRGWDGISDEFQFSWAYVFCTLTNREAQVCLYSAFQCTIFQSSFTDHVLMPWWCGWSTSWCFALLNMLLLVNYTAVWYMCYISVIKMHEGVYFWERRRNLKCI